MNLIVSAVRSEAIEVTKFGEAERVVVAGPTYVEFQCADGQRFELEWTYRGQTPAVGSKWSLVEVTA